MRGRCLLAALLGLLALACRAAAAALTAPADTGPTAGADVSDCRSVLHIGITSCPAPAPDPGPVPPVDEEQVDRYLADYGKPPREAVRALLDPTDANIAAWAVRQRQTMAVAAYVAARLTELQARLAADREGADLGPALPLPAVSQMRVTLFLDANDAVSLEAVRALEQVASRYPSIQARLVHVGATPRQSALLWVARLATALPLSIAPAQEPRPELPSLLLEDLRAGSRMLAPLHTMNAAELLRLIVSSRAAVQTGNRASDAQ